MKHALFSVILLTLMVLVACGPIPTPTASPPPPTDTPEPTSTPIPQVNDTVEPSDLVEPGGIDVALALVTIPDQETIALVNEEEISTAVYQEELNRALASVTDQYGVDWNDPENRALLPSLQEQVLEQIIGRVLLRQLAGQEEIAADPEEVEAEIVAIQDQVQADETIAD